jgi:hypothetical protein
MPSLKSATRGLLDPAFRDIGAVGHEARRRWSVSGGVSSPVAVVYRGVPTVAARCPDSPGEGGERSSAGSRLLEIGLLSYVAGRGTRLVAAGADWEEDAVDAWARLMAVSAVPSGRGPVLSSRANPSTAERTQRSQTPRSRLGLLQPQLTAVVTDRAARAAWVR